MTARLGVPQVLPLEVNPVDDRDAVASEPCFASPAQCPLIRSCLKKTCRPSRTLLKKTCTKWDSWQLCHQGKYSIERLMAMDNYYRTTSVLRMLLVCIMTPLPALVISILIELIPLQSPHAGAFANWGFWIRNWVTLFIMIMAMTTQVKVIIPELPFTTAKCLIISAMATSIYISIGILIGGYIVFPIPFMSVLGGVPGVAIACATVLLVLRIRPSTMDPAQRTQLARFFRICFSSGLLLITYPAYNVAFVASNTTAQGLLIVALQVMKIGAKNVTAKALAHLEDYLPEYVVFLVEVFNALYLTSCLQATNSIQTVMLIFGLDCALVVWEMFEVKRRSTVMERLISECSKRNPSSSNLDFLAFAIDICSKTDKLHRKVTREISLRACLKHNVSPGHAKLLETLEAHHMFSLGGRERRESHTASGSRVFPLRDASLPPMAPVLRGPRPSTLTRDTTAVARDALMGATKSTGARAFEDAFRSFDPEHQHGTNLLVETLQGLFHVEYLVLVEYVECIVPFVYVAYSAVRSRLPSDAFYPHSLTNTSHEEGAEWSFLSSVVLYTAFELLSLVLLNMLYWWKFRFLPLYQLAFVLENQFELIQSKLVLWIVLLLQFELYHYGADFTFRFSWIKGDHQRVVGNLW
ncbi:hypothetical protein Gpo141_00000464 [Globisporangium polare]